MTIAMSDLEKYINENDEYDPLVRAALIHYQFETIHPFLDGNGRIGRLLILLYLIQQKLLDQPILYVSYFLKKIRSNIMTACQKSAAAVIMSNGSGSSSKRCMKPQLTRWNPFINYPGCMNVICRFSRFPEEASIT